MPSEEPISNWKLYETLLSIKAELSALGERQLASGQSQALIDQKADRALKTAERVHREMVGLKAQIQGLQDALPSPERQKDIDWTVDRSIERRSDRKTAKDSVRNALVASCLTIIAIGIIIPLIHSFHWFGQ